MIARDGLASVACETRSARILAGIAVSMNVLALYFFFTEVTYPEIINAILMSITIIFSLPTDPQLLLEQEAWLQWRIPLFNSYDGLVAAALGGGLQAITAIYFVGSALRARRYLSVNSGIANKAAMQRLVERVLSSGCLMLIITMAYGIGGPYLFHPISFTALFTIVSPVSMANSMLQLASFAPPAGAPPGPVEEVRLALKRVVQSAVGKFNGEALSFTSVSPEPEKTANDRNGRLPSAKMLFNSMSTKKVTPSNAWFTTLENSLHGRRRSSMGWLSIGASQGEGHRASFSSRLSSSSSWNANRSAEASTQAPPNATGCQKRNAQDELAPCDRLGLSFSMLEAFVTHYDITPEMTTTDVCDRYIKPYTLQRKCCYMDLLEDSNLPGGWVGKTTHFASHWWVDFRIPFGDDSC